MSQNKKENKDDINKPNTENKWSEFFYASIANFIYTIIWGLFSSSFIFYILIKLYKENNGRNLLEYYFPIKDEYYNNITQDDDHVIINNINTQDNTHINDFYNSYLALFTLNVDETTKTRSMKYYENKRAYIDRYIWHFFSLYVTGVDDYPVYPVNTVINGGSKRSGGSKLQRGGDDKYVYEDCHSKKANKKVVNDEKRDIYKYNFLERWMIYSINTVLKTIAKSLKFERANIIHTIFEFFCNYTDKKQDDNISVSDSDNKLFNGKLKKIVFILSPLIILLIIIASIITNVLTSILYGFGYIFFISKSPMFLIFGGFIFPFITSGLIGFYTFFEILFMFTFFPLYKNYPEDNNLIQKILSNNKNVLIFIFSVLSIISSFDYLKLEISISMIVFCVLYYIKTMFF